MVALTVVPWLGLQTGQLQGEAGCVRRSGDGQQHRVLLRAAAQRHRLPSRALYRNRFCLFAPCTIKAVAARLTLHPLRAPDGTSLTDVANKVAHVNDRLIMFANAQAEEIYNHGYPLIFGVGTASTPFCRLLFSPLVEPVLCLVLCCVVWSRHIRLSLRRPGRVLSPNARC